MGSHLSFITVYKYKQAGPDIRFNRINTSICISNVSVDISYISILLHPPTVLFSNLTFCLFHLCKCLSPWVLDQLGHLIVCQFTFISCATCMPDSHELVQEKSA